MAVLGFVGTGALAEAVIRGLQKTDAKAHRFLVSPRSESRARALAEAFENTSRAASNEAVVADSDIVCLGVLPKQIGDLKGLPFRADQIVVSFLAGVPLTLLRQHVAPATRIVRMIPMPCIEFGEGPILMTPADPTVEALFGLVGELVVPALESDLDTISLTSGFMSTHFQLQNTLVAWLQSREIAPPVATRYVRSLFSGLGALALEMDRRNDPLPPEEYETPGGLNAFVRSYFNEAEWFDAIARALDGAEAHRRTLMRSED
ncbi:NAD(P)-binding domain-containing protein [Acidisoma sp. 7E03]